MNGAWTPALALPCVLAACASHAAVTQAPSDAYYAHDFERSLALWTKLLDEGVRPETTTESLSGLRPAFAKDGTITAGNASQISDGAAALVVMSRDKAEELNATPIAELVGFGMVAGPDTSLLTQPSRAIKRALDQVNLPLADVDLFELNEAFAAVGIASMRDLGISDDVVNVNGGAIAVGHPVGVKNSVLSEGLVSSVGVALGGDVPSIGTTAAISHGSSGGRFGCWM